MKDAFYSSQVKGNGPSKLAAMRPSDDISEIDMMSEGNRSVTHNR